jgi:hypothetical protein
MIRCAYSKAGTASTLAYVLKGLVLGYAAGAGHAVEEPLSFALMESQFRMATNIKEDPPIWRVSPFGQLEYALIMILQHKIKLLRRVQVRT